MQQHPEEPIEGHSFCYIHYKQEPITEIGRVCFECKHSYQDNGEIISVARAEWGVLQFTSIDDIFSCPLCIHDW